MPEQQQQDKAERFEQLTSGHRQTQVNRGYTRFVKSMRLILPLAALGLIAVVMTWPEMEDKIAPIAREDILPQSPVVKNELISPRFESTDEKQQPFTITASKAIQNQDNPELVRLDKPMADMLLESGAWVAIEAKSGIYEQNTEKLFLQEDVKLFHDTGYQLETDELRIDMNTRQVWSDKTVNAQGPDAALQAAGLSGDANAATLIFNGPATLVLINAGEALPFGKTLP